MCTYYANGFYTTSLILSWGHKQHVPTSETLPLKLYECICDRHTFQKDSRGPYLLLLSSGIQGYSLKEVWALHFALVVLVWVDHCCVHIWFSHLWYLDLHSPFLSPTFLCIIRLCVDWSVSCRMCADTVDTWKVALLISAVLLTHQQQQQESSLTTATKVNRLFKYVCTYLLELSFKKGVLDQLQSELVAAKMVICYYSWVHVSKSWGRLQYSFYGSCFAQF